MAQHAVVVSLHVQKVTVRTELAGEAQDSAWTQTRLFTYNKNGTNDHEQPRSVPFGPARSNRRHAIIASGVPARSSFFLTAISPYCSGGDRSPSMIGAFLSVVDRRKSSVVVTRLALVNIMKLYTMLHLAFLCCPLLRLKSACRVVCCLHVSLILQASAWSLTNGNCFCVPTSGHQNQHEHVFLKLDQELRDIKSSMKSDYLEWSLLDWPRMGEKKRRIFDDSVITAATAR